MKKVLTVLFSFCISFSLALPTSASNISSFTNYTLSEQVTQFLDTSPTTQVILVKEKDCIDMMLEAGAITRNDLNAELEKLSNKSTQELYQQGYTTEQINMIKSYTSGSDAYNHVFSMPPNFNSTRSSATLRFRYGLAGHSARRSVTIAYDMNWSSAPMWRYTDCFGVGWIVADSESQPLTTKINSAIAQADYYFSNGKPAYDSKDVDINDFSSAVILGYPKMSNGNTAYAKHISGITNVSTQSNSNNIDTVQLFVAYGHTTLDFSIGKDVSLGFTIDDQEISFTPSVQINQEIIAHGKWTFDYDDTISIDAEN
mgnify:CR=1 FL=1